MKQPLSVTIVCWVIIALSIEAIFGLLSGIVETSLQEMLNDSRTPMTVSSAVAYGVAVGAVTLGLAASMLFGANWARIAYVVLTGVLLLGMFANPGLSRVLVGYAGLKLAIFGFFLFRPIANEYFSHQEQPAA